MIKAQNRKLVRDKVLAEEMDCSVATVWRRVADGTLPPPIKIGGISRFDYSEYRDAVEAARARRRWPMR